MLQRIETQKAKIKNQKAKISECKVQQSYFHG